MDVLVGYAKRFRHINAKYIDRHHHHMIQGAAAGWRSCRIPLFGGNHDVIIGQLTNRGVGIA